MRNAIGKKATVESARPARTKRHRALTVKKVVTVEAAAMIGPEIDVASKVKRPPSSAGITNQRWPMFGNP